MNDLNRLAVMLYQFMMHYETELDEKIQNSRHILDQAPTPEAARRYCEALQAREQFNEMASRIRSVLDFFRGDEYN